MQPPVEPIEGQLSLVPPDDPGEDTSLDALALPAPYTDDAPPRIEAVIMRNFKGFESCRVVLANFNVLVGTNNAGKSTLLQAIDLVFVLLKVHADTGALRLNDRKLVASSILPVATGPDLWHRRKVRAGNQNVYCEVGFEFVDGSRVRFGLRFLYGGINSAILDQQGMEGARLGALLAHPANWVPSATGIVRDEEYRTPARRAALINAGRHNEVVRNLLVELRDDRPEQFEFLRQLLVDRFGASIEGVAFDGTTDQFVTAEYESEGTRHDIYSAGAGFVQILQMLAFILGRDAGIVLLDEPDAHLHSGLQRVISDLLRALSIDRGFQVIIATHSKEIINSVDPTNLVLMEKGAEHAEVGSETVTPMTVLQSLGDIDNVDAYALLRNRRCLFIEGKKDHEVFSRFAATLKIAAFVGDDRVVTIPVGGADRFEHVSQLQVIEGLLGGEVASLEIRDRDGRQEQTCQQLVADSGRPLHILQRDCIESYLIDAAVIARCVGGLLAQRSAEATPPTVEELEALIDEVTDEMRDGAVDRLVARWQADKFSLDRQVLSVTAAGPEARAVVEAAWETPEGRLTVLSGKALLSRLRKEIQDRCGVNFGNPRIAEEFGPDEIPEELAELLRQAAALAPPG